MASHSDRTLPPDHYAVYVDDRTIPFGRAPNAERPEGHTELPSTTLSLLSEADPVARTPLVAYTAFERWRPLTEELATLQPDPGVRIFYLYTPPTFPWRVTTEVDLASTRRTDASPNGYRPPLPIETWTFAVAHPDLADFIAPGVTVEAAEGTFYPQVVRLPNGKRLLESVYDGPQPRTFRLLLVRR